jgi:hypothetical protein
MAKFVWKVWLRNNKLTPNPTDYVAEVDTAGATRLQQDIIDHIVSEGSEVKAETIQAILERANNAKRYFVLRGYSVFDGIVHVTPRVTGSWEGKETFTEGKHKVTVDASLAKSLQEELKQVGVEVLGVADSGARILLVTDVATGNTDGVLTPGDDVVIAGNKIKVAGQPQPDGSPEPGIGVFFVSERGDVVPAARISENKPTRVVARVPGDIAPGDYTLRIVTRYTGGATLLKAPRLIDYELPLLVAST